MELLDLGRHGFCDQDFFSCHCALRHEPFNAVRADRIAQDGEEAIVELVRGLPRRSPLYEACVDEAQDSGGFFILAGRNPRVALSS